MSVAALSFCPPKLNTLCFHDIDVLIVNNNIRELRDKVMELDPRFADDRLKFYYVTEVRRCSMCACCQWVDFLGGKKNATS